LSILASSRESATATPADLVAAAEAMGPTLAARAAATEAARALSSETMNDLHEAGLLRYFVPRRYGGYEMDWGVQIQIGRTLARHCASTAWIGCVVGSHSAYVARMSPQAQDDVWKSQPDVLISTGSVMRNVSVQPADGGFVLNGRWSFSSGIDHAGWALMRASITNDHRQSYFLTPRADFTIEDDWRVSGMSGTGSKSVHIKDAFVPAHRVISMTQMMAPNPPGAAVNSSVVSTASFRLFAGSALLGPILGGAEAVLNAFRALMQDGQAGQDKEDPQALLRIAEAAAEIGTAGRLADGLIERQLEAAHSGAPVPKAVRIANVLERTYAARLCLNGAARLVNSLDAASITHDLPIQRHYRDLQGMVQQIGVNWDRNMINGAKAMFDLTTDIPDLNAD
jgi:3-hydroxy-9,10-secoandrosta-1,3,5(10)-triene-9,17-dione monooxygenase